jgi:cell division protein FtsQ
MAKWQQITLNVLWILFGTAAVVLFGAAAIKKGDKTCSALAIAITGTSEHVFADESDISSLLLAAGAKEGTAIKAINLRKLEDALEKNAWIKNAELFFDNNQVLHVTIAEREPIARVFTAGGSSWYVDSTGLRLPLSEKIVARVPVFTGFPSDNDLLSAPDSAVLQTITAMGNYINTDSFWHAQVSQINITPEGEYELIPIIGNHVVTLGSAENFEDKLNRLYSFYKQVAVKTGFDKYNRLDVQYKGQVVAIKKGTAVTNVDSTGLTAVVERLTNNSTQQQQIVDTTQQRNAAIRQQQNVPKAVLPSKKNNNN